MHRPAAVLLLGVAAAFGPPLAFGQQQPGGGADADALAKQLANPVASLVSVPLQLNYDAGLGPTGDGDRWQLNVQPVIPISLNEDWNVISRTILPVIHQDVPPGGSDSGLGDVTQSLFFSPKEPTANGWILGVGPAFLLPTASEDVLGTEQWAIGPTAVALKQTEAGWTYGVLANYLASVAGDNDRADVDAMFLQPFLVKALGRGRTASINFESTYDFEREAWTAPLNLAYTQVTKVGGQLVSFAVGGRAYLERPSGGPDWGVRFVVTLLYPK
jgi:hypothetical protein